MQSLKVIFDIDGVIVDSEQLHFDVLHKIVPTYIKNVKPQSLIGLSLTETLDYLGIEKIEQKNLIEKITKTYKEEINHSYLREGIKDFFKKLTNNSIPYGFVSTAPKEVCLANLKLIDLAEFPEVFLVSGDDVEKTKPYPDPYLKMLKLLKANPEQTIVIEDTDIGIEAATKAGISKVYAWPHKLSIKETYKKAIKVINSLDDISLTNYKNY